MQTRLLPDADTHVLFCRTGARVTRVRSRENKCQRPRYSCIFFTTDLHWWFTFL